MEGLQKIISIKAAMNKGLSNELKSNFFNVNIVDRPLILTKNIVDNNWIAGFVSGDLCSKPIGKRANFYINIHNSKSHKTGYQVQLRFRVSQNERDIQLMELLKKYLGSGTIEINTKTSVLMLTITKISIITKIIIPLFNKYPILGVKYLDYLDWCKIANLMSEGKHLTNEGLKLIKEIKSGLNSCRHCHGNDWEAPTESIGTDRKFEYFFNCMINLMIVLIGFFSKQFVLYSALQNGYYFISLIAIIVSVISASYYLKIIKVLHTDHDYFEDKLLKGAVEENKAPNQSNVLLNEDKEFKEVKEFKEEAIEGGGVCLTANIPIVTLILKEPKVGVDSRVGVSLSQSSDPILLDLDLDLEQSKTTLTNTHSFVISSLTLIILLFFIKPSIILNSTQLLSLSLFYI